MCRRRRSLARTWKRFAALKGISRGEIDDGARLCSPTPRSSRRSTAANTARRSPARKAARRTARRPTSSWPRRSATSADYKRAAAVIMGSNPLGGVCGAVCPDQHCMSACVHKNFDTPLEYPGHAGHHHPRAKELGVMPEFSKAKPNGKKVAVVGAGPAGLGAAALLAQKGYAWTSSTRAQARRRCATSSRISGCDERVLERHGFRPRALGRCPSRRQEGPGPGPARGQIRRGARGLGLDNPIRLGVPGEEAGDRLD